MSYAVEIKASRIESVSMVSLQTVVHRKLKLGTRVKEEKLNITNLFMSNFSFLDQIFQELII